MSAANSGDQNGATEVPLLFASKVANSRALTGILSCINLNTEGKKKEHNQFANITITKKGIQFLVEEAKTLQASTTLQSDLFTSYEHKDDFTFKINLAILLDCLNIFGTGGSTSNVGPCISFTYRETGNEGSIFFLMLEENGVVTTAAIRALEADEIQMLEFKLPAPPPVNKVVMVSEVLKEAFNEVDWANSEATITLLLSPESPFFSLYTAGTSGSCQVDYPKESVAFDTFACNEPLAFKYKLKLMQPAVKALTLAIRTTLQMNQKGLLRIQHQIKGEDGPEGHVDFFLNPIFENDDE